MELAFQDHGPRSGPPILLVHGFGAWSETWRSVIDALTAQGSRVIAVDLPPFGFSEEPRDGAYSRETQARRIIALLDALEIERATFVGHSVGARPTLTAALAAPSRVERLVLVDAALGFAPGSEAVKPSSTPGLVARLFEVRWLRNALLASTATNPMLSRQLLGRFVADADAIPQQTLELYQRPLVQIGATNRLGDWLHYFARTDDAELTEKPEIYRKLTMPTLIVWGEDDRITPLWQGKRLAEMIPGAQLAVMQGVNHIPQIEQPAEFNRILLAFLERR